MILKILKIKLCAAHFKKKLENTGNTKDNRWCKQELRCKQFN